MTSFGFLIFCMYSCMCSISLVCEALFDQKQKNKQKNTFLAPVYLCGPEIIHWYWNYCEIVSWKGKNIPLDLYDCFSELVPHCQKGCFHVPNTFCLTVPAGWEGWRLHQPPRVQNRPSYRVPAEIVSVAPMPLKWIITHVGSRRTPRKPLMSSSPWLQCLQSVSSQNQELLLCHRLSWRDEQVRLSLHYSLWTMAERLGTSRVL